jgi:MFS family permease
VTYRSVLANREFAALVVAQGMSTLGDQLARIAIAFLVYERTGSTLGASATYAVSFFPYVIGGPLLSAISDRRPRVGVMVTCDLLRAPAVLTLCVADVPLWTYFVILGLLGLLSPPFDSARSALQPEILQGDAYVTGSGLMNLVLQSGQVLGFLAGGALVALISARGAIALDAASFIISAGFVLGCVAPRPAAQAPQTRQSLLADTREGFRYVRGSAPMRRYLLFSVLTAAAVVAPEGLAVPTSEELGHGSVASGFLTASLPAGVVLGGILILRLLPDRRLQVLPIVSLLCPLPLLLSPVVQDVWSVFFLWFLAGMGACVSVVAAAAYVQASPPELRSRTYGVAVATLQAGQGLALLLSGSLAEALGPRGGVATLAGMTVLALVTIPGLSAPGSGFLKKKDLSAEAPQDD